MSWDALVLDGLGSAVADHLWQSTVCLALAALCVWLAGPGRPSLRHAIWLGASIKFLVPVSLIMAAGEQLAPVVRPLPVPVLQSVTFRIIGEPFTTWAGARATVAPVQEPLTQSDVWPWTAVTIWALGAMVLLARKWRRWQHVRSIVSASAHVTSGREVDALCRVHARRHWTGRSLQLRQIAGAAAPALFGIRRGVILWPAGLSSRLRDDAIEAVVAHEVAHFRRGDNLAALVHGLVEAVLWFHPLLWWVSARLIEERERACDQEALDCGVPPETYARTLLNVCRFGLAAPQPFIASAAGASLGERVEAIMNYEPGRLLARPRGLAVALAILLVGGPLAMGIGRAQERRTDPPSQGVYRGGGITALRQIQPTYSAAALRAGIEGTVELEALILHDGTVGEVRVVKSLDRQFGLDEQAVKAARLWRFRPPVDASGAPVRAMVTLILDFRLPEPPAAQGRARAESAEIRTTQTLPRDRRPATPSQDDLEFRSGALSPDTPALMPPKAIRTVSPRYTSEAMTAKVQGSVEVEVVVGSEGDVERARVTRSLHPDLDAEALAAIRQWRFDPATLDGTAVVTWMRVTMDFRLY